MSEMTIEERLQKAKNKSEKIQEVLIWSTEILEKSLIEKNAKIAKQQRMIEMAREALKENMQDLLFLKKCDNLIAPQHAYLLQAISQTRKTITALEASKMEEGNVPNP